MDGGAGPCLLDLRVTGTDAKPVHAATIKIHIAYGFGGIRRLDLEAGTNSDGKVKFTGLPVALIRVNRLQIRSNMDSKLRELSRDAELLYVCKRFYKHQPPGPAPSSDYDCVPSILFLEQYRSADLYRHSHRECAR